jgi:OmpA-OmpF porin, OOP family
MDGRGGAVLQPGLAPLSAHGFGDVRFDLKWRLAGRAGDAFGFALATPFTVPSGRGDLFRGEQDATFSPRLIFDGQHGRVTFAAQVGYLVRRELLYVGQKFGNELIYGAGLGVALWRDQGGPELGQTRNRLSLAAELFGRASAVKPFDNTDQVPLEALGGLTFTLPNQNLALHAGLGFGLNTSYGTPEVRAFFGLRWTSSVAKPRPCPKVEAPPPPPPCPVAPACPAQKACPAEKVCPSQPPCKECPACVECKACPAPIECPAAPPPVTRVRLRHVYFDLDKADPLERSRPSLDRLTELLKKYPTLVVRVEGHTDSRGSARYNKKLSQRRADGVRAYLLSHGIAAERVTAVGHGPEKPVAPNTTKAGRRENRRVEVHFTSGVPDQLKIDLEKMEF